MPAFSDFSVVVTGTALVPEPALDERRLRAVQVDVPYSTYQVVERPLGVTAPPTLADVAPSCATAPALTPGGAAVTNERSELRETPASLVATTLK